MLGWTGDNGDPDNFLAVLLGCDAVGGANRAQSVITSYSIHYTKLYEMQTLMASILQDLGEIPPEYLVAGGDGGYVRNRLIRDPADVWKGVYHEEGALLYNEWDYRRQHYRKNWCVLRELDVHPATEPFVERTLEKYRGLVAHLRKTFEALRGEDKLLRRRNNGDDIDLDATIEAYADMRHSYNFV